MKAESAVHLWLIKPSNSYAWKTEAKRKLRTARKFLNVALSVFGQPVYEFGSRLIVKFF